PGPLLALLHVERPPLGTLVDHLVVQDEATLLADQLAAFVVKGEVPRVALRASSDFFGLFDLLGRHGFPLQRRRRLRSETTARGRSAGRRRTAPGLGRTLSRPVRAAGSACPARRRLARGRTPRGRGPSHRGRYSRPRRGVSCPLSFGARYACLVFNGNGIIFVAVVAKRRASGHEFRPKTTLWRHLGTEVNRWRGGPRHRFSLRFRFSCHYSQTACTTRLWVS